MTEQKTLFDRQLLRLTMTLLAFAALVAALLGLVNHITEGPIAAYKKAKTESAMRAVLAADHYEAVALPTQDERVESICRADDKGWVVTVTPSGFGGVIRMVVGIDNDGVVTGLSIVSLSETSGLGGNAVRESFRSQFLGTSGSVALSKNGGGIDALTGATVTSTAVVGGVNAALDAVSRLS